MKKVKLSITGMHCASCANNVQRSLKNVKGVNECTVNPVANKAFLECDDSASEEDMKKAVAKVGYKVVKVE